MPFELPETLQPILLPLLIVVPLAILIIIITVRRGDYRDFGAPPPPAAGPAPRAAAPARASTTRLSAGVSRCASR